MSDNPTLWVRTDNADDAFISATHTPTWPFMPASRADVLAALPDKEWWCESAYWGEGEACTPDKRHTNEACHWAVKPC